MGPTPAAHLETAPRTIHNGGMLRQKILNGSTSDAWISICKATDEHWVVDAVTTFSTYPVERRYLWPPVKGNHNGNETHANWVVVQAGKRLVEVARQRPRLCPRSQVYNPFDGSCRPQLPIFSLFPRAVGRKLDRADATRIVRDWHGNIRPWSWDCEPNTYSHAYMDTNPQRMLQCMGPTFWPEDVVAAPVMEEEYFEWGHALMAVASAEPGGTFVVVEVGARYAPWAMRAVRAAEVLGRSSHFHAIAVEPDKKHVGWIHDHFKMNGMDPAGGKHTLKVVQGGFCERIHPGHNYANCIASILEGVDHVDFLDIDAQGAEEFMLRKPADRAAFRRKVRRTHIETHTDNIWKEVADGLLELGFLIVQNTTWMYTGYNSSTYGPNWWRGGGLYAINAALGVPC